MNNKKENHATWQDVKEAFKRAVAGVWFARANYEARRRYARWQHWLAGCHEAALIAVIFGCAAMAGWMAATL